jgi:hypothetical protein
LKSERCVSCGQLHEKIPLSYGPSAPEYWYATEESQRATRWMLSDDVATMDDQHFFIRGRLEIPIIDHPEPFVWLVWTTLSREDFQRTFESWETEGRENEPPMFGWLSTVLPYPDTINLKTNVHTRPVGLRPRIELEPTDHPLAIEQRTGITWKRVEELTRQFQAIP